MPKRLVTALCLCLDAATLSAQTIADRVRAAKQQSAPYLELGMLGEPVPLSLEDLTKQADIVITGTITRLRVYADDSDTHILTDYAITPSRLFAGTLPSGVATPGVAVGLTLVAYGGELTRDGMLVRAVNHGLEPLQEGISYLLFLKKFAKSPGVYQIYNAAAFDLSTGAARPVARQGNDLFRDLSNIGYDQLVPRIVAAALAK